MDAALEARARQLQAVSELGLEALAQPALGVLAERAVIAVAKALGVEIVTVDELQGDGDLAMLASVGLEQVLEPGELASPGSGSLAGYTLLAGKPVSSSDLPNDSRFSLRPSFRRAGMRAAIGVAIGTQGAQWGVLIAGTTVAREFTGDDIAFIQSVANLLQAVRQLERGEHELQRLAQAVEQASDAIVSVDLDWRISHWSAGAERLFGVRAQDAVGRTIDEINQLTRQPEATKVAGKGAIGHVLGSERPTQFETNRYLDDGTVLCLSVEVTPWRVDGQIAGVTNIINDITARKQAEQENARLAAIVEASDDAIIGKTLTGEIISWNRSAERIYGYSAAEAVGEHISLVVPEDRLSELDRIMKTVAAGVAVRHLETRRRRKDGQVIDVSLTVTPVRDSQGTIVAAATVGRDLTEREQTERAREQALHNLAEAQRLAKLGSWTWYPETDAGTWSAQMYEIFGRDPAVGPAVGETFFAYLHPEDRERTVAAYAQTFGGGSNFDFEFRVLHRDGGIRHLRLLGYEDKSNPGRYVGTVQDVTDQRLAEQERAEMLAATVRAESANRAKSEFVARMSHELRTPLNSIMGFSQLLEIDELDQRQHQRVTYVLKAARHLLELINEVLDLSGIEAGRLTISSEPVALAVLVDETVALVGPLAAEREVELRVDASGLIEDGHVRADRNRLKQVLLNLLSNAIKYNRLGGRVDVSFSLCEPERVRTTIADTGLGIAADRLPQLFEPFERLGAELTETEGTGLGLALAKGLVEAMGGTIEVESVVGQGTRVTVELAQAQRPSAEREPAPKAGDLIVLGQESSRQTILYIEDNLSNLTLVEQILEPQSGVQLIPAMQGTIGLELARQHQPALIMLDLHLPDMPGLEVLQRLKADPSTSGIPVLVLTADAVRGQAARARSLGAAYFLTKPLDVKEFLQTVSEALRLGP